jgi:hypothetical protein
MDLEKPAKSTLRYLFSEYKKGPAVLYPINDVCRKFDVDPVVLSNYLLENSLIRECWTYSNNTVACRITIKGIETIDPVYVRDRLDRIIGGLADAGQSRALIEILEYDLKDFPIAMDLVNQLETLGLVKIHNVNHVITVELTAAGLKHNERRKGGLFALTA